MFISRMPIMQCYNWLQSFVVDVCIKSYINSRTFSVEPPTLLRAQDIQRKQRKVEIKHTK